MTIPGVNLLRKVISSSSSRLRFFADVGSLSVSTVVSRALLLIRDLALARLLGPALYGVWTQMVVVFNYALQLPLGFQHAMSREVPYYYGQGNQSRVKAIQDIVFTVMLSTAAFASVGIVLAYWLFDYRLFNLSPSELMVVSGVVIVQQVYAFYSILLRAHQRFSTFSIGFAAVALLSLIVAAVTASRWGANGAALAQGLAYILVTFYWLSRAEFRPLDVGFPLGELWRLARLAIPLFVVGLSGLLIVSMDRLAVAFFYGEEQVGSYGLAFLVNQSIYLLVTPIVQAISPRLMEAYGRYKDPRRVKHYLVLLTVVMGGGVALLIGAVYLIVGDLLPLLLPRFASAVEPVRVLLMGGAFSALAGGANNFLIAVDKQGQVLKIQAGVIVLQAVSIGVVVYLGGSISYIAGAMALNYILYATLSLFWAGLSVGDSAWQGVGLWLKSCLPIFYVLLGAVLISQWHIQVIANTYLVTIFHLLTWGAVVLPACFYVFKELRRVKI